MVLQSLAFSGKPVQLCRHTPTRFTVAVQCVANSQQDRNINECSYKDCQSSKLRQGCVNRRAALVQLATLGALVAWQVPQSHASETTPQRLPKAYKEVVRKLSKALRESIEAEQAGEKESEVRRKADPAKEALQTFVKRWKDDPKVVGHPSHTQVIAVLTDLGAFYQQKGPRARMPPDLQTRLLGYLSAAEDSLLTKVDDDEDSGDMLRSLLPS